MSNNTSLLMGAEIRSAGCQALQDGADPIAAIAPCEIPPFSPNTTKRTFFYKPDDAIQKQMLGATSLRFVGPASAYRDYPISYEAQELFHPGVLSR